MPVNDKQICLVAAMARNRAIGLGGRMPWHLPAELQHFKSTTMGKAIVMGRKTWESVGRPLPGRQNIVISRNRNFPQQGFTLCTSLQRALEVAQSREVMVIGGGELYSESLPMASRMVLTLVDCEPQADTYFPEWDASEWLEISRHLKPADEQNRYDWEIVEMQRIQPLTQAKSTAGVSLNPSVTF